MKYASPEGQFGMGDDLGYYTTTTLVYYALTSCSARMSSVCLRVVMPGECGRCLWVFTIFCLCHFCLCLLCSAHYLRTAGRLVPFVGCCKRSRMGVGGGGLYVASFLTFTYSLTTGVAWAPQMTSLPVSSIFLRTPLTAVWGLANSRPVHSLCSLSTSSSVCLVFFPLSLCLVRWFWPDLMNRKHVHTTLDCGSLR